MADEDGAIVGLEEQPKPPAVAEAEETVRRLGVALLGTGAGASVLWFLHALVVGFPVVPMAWLGIFLAALVLFFFFPQSRRARLAREVLRQWDDVRVQGMLEESGASTDPRLQAAGKMARRIARHPAADDELRRLTTDLVGALRRTTRDQRLVELALESRRGGDSRGSLSDSLDYLEARAARLLGSLSDIHGAVVKRDSQAVERVLGDAARTLAELEALEEVDRMLGEGEG